MKLMDIRKDMERNTPGRLKKLVMPLLLIVLLIFFSIMAPGTFLTWYNLRNILAQSSYVIIAAVGLTFVMLSGGVDLSIGYIMSICGVVAGNLIITQGLSIGIAIPAVILTGIILGLLNGIIVVKLKVFPLIITLSTAMIFQGISYTISNSATIIGFSSSFKFIGQGQVGQVPFCVIVCAIIVVVAAVVLGKTYFGRYIYATGGNEEAASLSGINTGRVRVIVYGISGLCAALAGIMLVSRAAAASSSLGPGTEFTALSGCILGGVALSGGEGRISGMIVGALIITILGNGMQLMYLGTYPQHIAKGVVLIAALGFDVYQRNKKTVRKLPA